MLEYIRQKWGKERGSLFLTRVKERPVNASRVNISSVQRIKLLGQNDPILSSPRLIKSKKPGKEVNLLDKCFKIIIRDVTHGNLYLEIPECVMFKTLSQYNINEVALRIDTKFEEEYVRKYATEEALRGQENNLSSDSESSMSDFSENEAEDMEL